MTALSETIELIEKAMEGVTPGPWYPGHLGTDSTCQCRSIVDDGIYMGAIATVHVDNGLPIGEGGNDAPPAEEAAANMRYIAACNPVAISDLIAAALKAEALKREIAELREAGEALAAQARSYQRGFSGTLPLGQALNNWDKASTSARALLSKESAEQDGSAITTSGVGDGR